MWFFVIDGGTGQMRAVFEIGLFIVLFIYAIIKP